MEGAVYLSDCFFSELHTPEHVVAFILLSIEGVN